MNFDQNRRIISEEKPEKHQTASNSKSKNPILFLPKTENRERNRGEAANRNRHQNGKSDVFRYETKTKKLPKPKIPTPPSIKLNVLASCGARRLRSNIEDVVDYLL